MQCFLDQLVVSVTSMFRDPGFYLAFRKVVIPLLKQQPTLRIWHAGCASGEEVYSMAILLHEEGLLDRSRIYATDLDQAGLDTARIELSRSRPTREDLSESDLMPFPLVVMGASLGTLEALRVLLPALPKDFAAALIIIEFPMDKEFILAGHVYVDPPNYHMLVEDDHFAYSLDEPEDYARPLIDALFESAAQAYGVRVTGIVLTGMRQDGARGLAAIHRRGGIWCNRHMRQLHQACYWQH